MVTRTVGQLRHIKWLLAQVRAPDTFIYIERLNKDQLALLRAEACNEIGPCMGEDDMRDRLAMVM